MIRIQTKLEGMKKYKGVMTPMAKNNLETNIHDSRNCFTHYAGEQKFKVDFYDATKVVDISAQTCSYKEWDLTGIPCKHAIAALQITGKKLEDYVHGYFMKELYLKIYSFHMSPVPGQGDWEVTNLIIVLLPYFKKPIRRPKKQRKRQPEEPRLTTKVNKKGGFITCSKCLFKGHNARTCKCEVHQKSKVMQSKNSEKVMTKPTFIVAMSS